MKDCKIAKSIPKLCDLPDTFDTLIWANNFLWESQFSTLVEAGMREIEEDRKVVFSFCDSSLAACPANPKHKRAICLTCRFVQRRQKRVLTRLGFKVALVKRSADRTAAPTPNTPEPRQEEVLSASFKGFPVGAYALSEMRHDTRKTRLSSRDLVKAAKLSKWAEGLVDLGEQLSQAHDFSRVIVWNGRRVSDGLLASVLEKGGISTRCVITGYSLQAFRMHSGASLLQNARQDFEAFRADRAAGLDVNAQSIERALTEISRYSHLQDVPGALNFDTSQRGSQGHAPFILLATSNWAIEASHLPEARAYERERTFERQISSLYELTTDLKIKVVVRWHPGLRDSNKATRKWIERISKSCQQWEHIPAESRVSTEELAREAQIVLDFGTTIGIYSRLVGTPTISCSPGSRYLPPERLFVSEQRLVEEMRSRTADNYASPWDAYERDLACSWVHFGMSRAMDSRRWTHLSGVHGPSFVRGESKWEKLSPTVLALRPSRLRERLSLKAMKAVIVGMARRF